MSKTIFKNSSILIWMFNCLLSYSYLFLASVVWNNKSKKLPFKKAYFAENHLIRSLRSKNSVGPSKVKKGFRFGAYPKETAKSVDSYRTLVPGSEQYTLKKVQFLGYNREGSGKSFLESNIYKKVTFTFIKPKSKERIFRIQTMCQHKLYNQHIGSKVFPLLYLLWGANVRFWAKNYFSNVLLKTIKGFYVDSIVRTIRIQISNLEG